MTGMHQRFDDDPGNPDGWDANGSPIAEPLHPLIREQQHEPHRCWICERTAPRASTPGGQWLIALVIGNSGKTVRQWTCSAVCQSMALALMYGYVEVERWYNAA